jgi:phosphate starvation-inducible PhoH-like protein
MAGVEFPDPYVLRQLAGDSCSHRKILEESIGVKCSLKGNTVDLAGEKCDVDLARACPEGPVQTREGRVPLYPDDCVYAVRMLAKDRTVCLEDVFKDSIYISSTKKVIVPKSLQQKRYIDAMRVKDILFGIGPAGTGKTYLALAMGISYLLKKKVERIVLARPAWRGRREAGLPAGRPA